MRLCVGYTRLFGYQHVGIGNEKFLRWVYSPSVKGLMLWWNIGFTGVRLRMDNKSHNSPYKTIISDQSKHSCFEKVRTEKVFMQTGDSLVE